MPTIVQGLGLFAINVAVGLAMLALFTRLYLWITPYNDAAQINDGQQAPAIALCGAMLGFTFPLLAASWAQTGIVDYVAWGVIAGVVQTVTFWVLHALLPRVIETNNSAGAICFAGASVCTGLIAGISLIP